MQFDWSGNAWERGAEATEVTALGTKSFLMLGPWLPFLYLETKFFLCLFEM